jgi:hypothetical protein
MKNLLVFIILALVTTSSFSQNLSLDQIVEIRKKNLVQAEEFLTQKGWDFEDGVDSELFTIVYFNYKSKNKSGQIVANLDFISQGKTQKVRVSVTFLSRDKYSEYINRINEFGCKLLESKIRDSKLIKTYQGSTTTFILESSTAQNDTFTSTYPIFKILVLSNEDFVGYAKQQIELEKD